MDKTCILIVDDNPEIREIINVLLGGEGFEVSEAENGAQALTLIEQQDFDLIILDIMMPGPNGYQTCRKIRELPMKYKDIARELGCAFFNAQEVLTEEDLGGDGLHLLPQGHQKLAEEFTKKVTELLG